MAYPILNIYIYYRQTSFKTQYYTHNNTMFPNLLHDFEVLGGSGDMSGEGRMGEYNDLNEVSFIISFCDSFLVLNMPMKTFQLSIIMK